MPSMLSTAIQNTFIKAAANLTAQVAAQWTSKEPQALDLQRIVEFAIFGFVGAHVGYTWQLALERAFPTQVAVVAQSGKGLRLGPTNKDDEKKLGLLPTTTTATATATGNDGPTVRISKRNVMTKLVADQTLGLSMMITIFLIITNIARLHSLFLVGQVIRSKIFELVRAGWHLWPLVAMCNFLWVPVRWRVLVSSCVGFGWNIFLSVHAMASTAATKGA
jgi:protein Mpv17